MSLPPQLLQSLFIAGTDTGVGKTWVATRLLRAWVSAGYRAAGMKPVAAGADSTPAGLRNEDALALACAGNVELAYEVLNPVCLERPTSPHLAALESGIDVDLETIKRSFALIASKTEFVAVEGAGGWWAPIADPPVPGTRGATMADVASAVGLPVLLVVGLRLGSLNHALLAANAIERSGCRLAGWIANVIDPEFVDARKYVDSLERRIAAPRVALPDSVARR